jgi:hypothetical protein
MGTASDEVYEPEKGAVMASRQQRAKAELETIRDAEENLAEAPPQALILAPKRMALGAIAMGIAGAAVGLLIGFIAAVAIYGLESRARFFAVLAGVGVAGLVAGGVIGGWRGGVTEKAIDEHRPSHRGRAPGTRPIRPDEAEEDKPAGWD